jgi:hypothetical protein
MIGLFLDTEDGSDMFLQNFELYGVVRVFYKIGHLYYKDNQVNAVYSKTRIKIQSMAGLLFDTEDGSDMFLRNVGCLSMD